VLLAVVIAVYQNQKNVERQERHAREEKQCIKIFEASFGEWPPSFSDYEFLLGEKIDASRAAASREFQKFRLDTCIANRISKKEATELEKAEELEIEARTSCAHQANIASERESLAPGLPPLKFKTLNKTDQEIESIYGQAMRSCMETRGFEYRE